MRGGGAAGRVVSPLSSIHVCCRRGAPSGVVPVALADHGGPTTSSRRGLFEGRLASDSPRRRHLLALREATSTAESPSLPTDGIGAAASGKGRGGESPLTAKCAVSAANSSGSEPSYGTRRGQYRSRCSCPSHPKTDL